MFFGLVILIFFSRMCLIFLYKFSPVSLNILYLLFFWHCSLVIWPYRNCDVPDKELSKTMHNLNFSDNNFLLVCWKHKVLIHVKPDMTYEWVFFIRQKWGINTKNRSRNRHAYMNHLCKYHFLNYQIVLSKIKVHLSKRIYLCIWQFNVVQ